MRSRTAVCGLLASLLLLTACGARDAGPLRAELDGASGADEPTDEAAVDGSATDAGAASDGAAAGACLEGAEDCVDADLGGHAPPPEDLAFDLEAARRDAEGLLGQSEEEVLELWGDVRVGRRGDEEFALTFDLQPGRKTIATEDDGTGTYRVVEVVLETEDGPETFTAG